MEIISIPLSGDLEHQDSMGNKVVIKEGDVQVMSAGTGIQHSEYNKNSDQEVQFLQIWVYPRERNVTPRYDQITLADIHKDNSFYQILSPNKDDEGVWINQDAWFHLGEFSEESQGDYQLRDSENGVYAFVIEGTITIGDETLEKRDGLAIEETKSFMYEATPGTKVLLMEVPMNKKVII
jgi:redox-sensitive bicupin YhaK (pirin superfamily)